jgi:hypothetical protein
MTPQAQANDPMNVSLEVGTKRVFACVLDWPGWCRSGKNEEQALDAVAAYAERYAAVAREAGVAFPDAQAVDFQVVERLPGTAGHTDFGAPGEVATSDWDPLTAEEAARLAMLVKAAWAVFDQVAASAPADLRKGPRGGGRDRDGMIDHVLGAEAAYARKLGITRRLPTRDDARAIAALRDAIVAALKAPSHGTPRVPKGWPPRYAARRIAWHVLDHAWEMEDRSDTAR